MKNVILCMVGEIASLIAALISYPVPATLFDPRPGMAETRPILLVHGYLHNSSAWYLFRQRLTKAGHGPIYTINLGSPLHGIEHYAHVLKKKADKIAQETGRQDLTLIGHSMGGIVSCYYAACLAPPDTVKQVFTLGSPLQGTTVADYGYGECTKQMEYTEPPTAFIAELLNGISNTYSVQFCHIGSITDRVVLPPDSAFPPFHKPHIQTYSLEDVGHLSLLYSKEVTQIVIDELNRDQSPQPF